jgi:hypothetical protein
MVQN